jgi:hypothetical protein
MERLKIMVCFGSGIAFVNPFASMSGVLTDITAIVFSSNSSHM